MVSHGYASDFRALIVDDDDIVRRVLSRALSQEGFVCDTAENGEHALRLLSGGPTYELLVTDLRMPYKNGHALSVDALNSSVRPVVMVHTAVEEPRLAKDLISRGVDDVVFKPTNYRVFAAKARGFVTRRHERPSGDEHRESSVVGFSPSAPQTTRDGHRDSTENLQQIDNAASQPGTDGVDDPSSHSDVAFDVYSMAMRDDCEPDELAAAIEKDALLAAEVLKLANSANSRARHNETDSVEMAVIRLGRRRVGELALSLSQYQPSTDETAESENLESTASVAASGPGGQPSGTVQK